LKNPCGNSDHNKKNKGRRENAALLSLYDDWLRT
jgi:hypothetical protein